MGLITRTLGDIGRWLTKVTQVDSQISALLNVERHPWEEVYGKQSQDKYEELVKRYTSWVYACAYKNAKSVAQVPLHLYGMKRSSRTKFIVPTRAVSKERKDWMFAQPDLQQKLAKAVDIEEIVDHPFLDLMTNVNEWMNGIDLMELWTLYQELTGNAYTYVVKNNLQIPQELWILPAQKVKIIPDKEMFIKSYMCGTDPAQSVTFEPDNIIHMKYPNPHDLYYGHGPLAAAMVAADAHVAMSAYEGNLLRNDAIPRSALITESRLTQDQVSKLKKEWNTNYKGVEKAGKLAVLSGGLQVAPVSLTPREMGYMAGRKITREEVAAIFEVPMSKLSVEDIKSAPAAGMYFGSVTYQRDTILPKCRKIEAKLNEKLLPMYDPNLFCAFDNPVGEDRDARIKERESNLRSGYSSINEERLRDNQEPVPWGEEPWLASNLIQTSSDRTSSLSPSLGGGGGGNAASIANSKYIDPDELPPERDSLVRIVKRLFKLQAQEVLSIMPKSAKDVKVVEDFWMPDEAKWIGWLVIKITPEMTKLVHRGVKRGLTKLNIGSGAVMNAPEISEFVNRHTFKFSFAVNSETQDILRKQLAAGLNAGENITALRGRVQDTFKGMSDYRADRIARTESVRAVNAGMEHGWQQTGSVEAKEWSGASDMCEFCQEMNSLYGPRTGGVTLGNAFIPQGEHLTATASGHTFSIDYGAIEHPPLHPNCKCGLLPVLKEAPVEDS